MIPPGEIRSAARRCGVPTSTIERDYAQDWLLFGLQGYDLALKGGTGIRKVHIPDYRFSDDLDFTMGTVSGLEEVRNDIRRSVASARDGSEIAFEETVAVRENRNGFVADIYFPMLLSGASRIKIKVDLTRPPVESILLPVEGRRMTHSYSDRCEAVVRSYSLEEIAAEKIRSLFQRTRARDLYDVYRLAQGTETDRQAVSGILEAKFRSKAVTLDIPLFTTKKDDFRVGWKSALRHQIRDLPDFEDVFGKVLASLESIHSGRFVLDAGGK